MRTISILLLFVSMHAIAVEAPPREFHGQLDGEPVWARWLMPDPAYGGGRLLQLVYTPPLPATIDGTHLIDCPFLLLDAEARVIAWNGRGTLSFIKPLEKGHGYTISRETETGTGDTVGIASDEQILHSPRVWDMRLLPVHLALIWTATGSGRAQAIDLFAAHPSPAIDIRWSPGQLMVGTAAWSIIADKQGYLAQVIDESGRQRLLVSGWKP